MIFSEDEECDSGALLLEDMRHESWWQLETDQTDEANHTLLSHGQKTLQKKSKSMHKEIPLVKELLHQFFSKLHSALLLVVSN